MRSLPRVASNIGASTWLSGSRLPSWFLKSLQFYRGPIPRKLCKQQGLSRELYQTFQRGLELFHRRQGELRLSKGPAVSGSGRRWGPHTCLSPAPGVAVHNPAEHGDLPQLEPNARGMARPRCSGLTPIT